MMLCPIAPACAVDIGARGLVFHLGFFRGLASGLVSGLVWAMLCTVLVPSASAAEPRNPLRIIAFGDSLVAGYQLALTDAFPAQLERALKAAGHDVEIANAGVSGDTTAAALARLDWAIPDGTDVVILELGANDMLRGLDTAAARRNLEAMITRIKAKGATILLAGMRSVDNWGADYAQRFDAIFPELAGHHGLVLYPFFMAGVVGRPELSLADGLHPNPRGVAQIVAGIQPAVEQLITRVRAGAPGRTAP